MGAPDVQGARLVLALEARILVGKLLAWSRRVTAAFLLAFAPNPREPHAKILLDVRMPRMDGFADGNPGAVFCLRLPLGS